MTHYRGQFSSHRLHNSVQMGLIVLGLTVVLAIPAWALAGTTGITWALLLVIVSMALASTVPPRLVLARAGAGLVLPEQAPQLYGILQQLYERAGLTARPMLYFVPDPRLNAFAVGGRHDGGIAVTEGLLRHLNLRQLAGVLAHEVCHLRHNDTRVMAMAASMTQLTAIGATIVQIVLILLLPWMLAGELMVHWLVLLGAAFAPSISTLLQLALSRNREFTADLEAAALTGDPRGLAAALKVLEHHHGGWLESLFGIPRRRNAPAWMPTHPPTGERIRRLLSLESSRPTHPLADMPDYESITIHIPTRPQARALREWLWR